MVSRHHHNVEVARDLQDPIEEGERIVQVGNEQQAHGVVTFPVPAPPLSGVNDLFTMKPFTPPGKQSGAAMNGFLERCYRPLGWRGTASNARARHAKP